jgi:hypothetical protein
MLLLGLGLGGFYYVSSSTPAPKPKTPAPAPSTPAPAPSSSSTPAPAPSSTSTPAPAPSTSTPPAPSAPKKNYTTKEKFDYEGNDITSLNNSTKLQCESKCNSDPKCVAYNFARDQYKGTCWIKNAAQNGTSSNYWDSYIVEGTPTSNKPVKCTADGSWSINTPVNVGDEVTQACPSGGRRTAKCNADGSWSVGDCPPPPEILIKWSPHNDKCFDVREGKNEHGAAIQIWSCDGGNGNQKFKLENGLIKWRYETGKCIDVPGGRDGNNTEVKLWSCDANNTNQQFRLENGMLRWRDTGKCLAVKDGKNESGNPIAIWTCNADDPNQKFSIS